MVTKEIVVLLKVGIKSKAATILVHEAAKFHSRIFLEYKDRKANAKSLLGVLSLAVGNGEKVVLNIDGADEKEAMKFLEDLLMGE